VIFTQTQAFKVWPIEAEVHTHHHYQKT